MVSASPSTPISTAAADRISKPGRGPLRPAAGTGAPAPPPAGPGTRSASAASVIVTATMPSTPAVEPLPGAQAAVGRHQLVGVVGHQDEVGGLVLRAVRPGEAQVERLGARAEQAGQQGRGGAQLGVPVLRGLDHLGVQPERGVVHERAAVHRRPGRSGARPRPRRRPARRPRPRGPGPGPGRSGCGCPPGRRRTAARPRRHRGHQRLRAVAAGHAEAVRAPAGPRPRPAPGGRRRVPGATGSMPRRRHSLASANRSAFPPPDLGFMISTGCSAAAPARPGRVRAAGARSVRPSACRAASTDTAGRARRSGPAAAS